MTYEDKIYWLSEVGYTLSTDIAALKCKGIDMSPAEEDHLYNLVTMIRAVGEVQEDLFRMEELGV